MDVAQIIAIISLVVGSSFGGMLLTRFFATRDLKKAKAKETEDASDAVSVRKIDEESNIRKELREENKRLVEQHSELRRLEIASLKQEFAGCQQREEELRIKFDAMSENLLVRVKAEAELKIKISELETRVTQMQTQISELLNAAKPVTETVAPATLVGTVTVEQQEIKVVQE